MILLSIVSNDWLMALLGSVVWAEWINGSQTRFIIKDQLQVQKQNVFSRGGEEVTLMLTGTEITLAHA